MTDQTQEFASWAELFAALEAGEDVGFRLQGDVRETCVNDVLAGAYYVHELPKFVRLKHIPATVAEIEAHAPEKGNPTVMLIAGERMFCSRLAESAPAGHGSWCTFMHNLDSEDRPTRDLQAVFYLQRESFVRIRPSEKEAYKTLYQTRCG